MKTRSPRWRAGAARGKQAQANDDNPSLACPPRPDNSPPIEAHFLADDVIVWHEVPVIELLCGHAQGPGRLGDLMRAARRA